MDLFPALAAGPDLGSVVLLWAVASAVTTAVLCAVLSGARRSRTRAAELGLRDPLLQALDAALHPEGEPLAPSGAVPAQWAREPQRVAPAVLQLP